MKKKIKACDLNNISIKSIEELINKINEQEFIYHNGNNHWFMTPPEIKKIIENIIREHFNISDNEYTTEILAVIKESTNADSD